MNIWNEKGAFCHNYTHLQQVGEGVLLESSCLSIRLQADWFPDIQCQPFYQESPYHAYGLPIAFGSKGQRSSTLDIKVAILCLGSRELSILPRFTISYMGQIYIWFSGSRALSFLPRVTISYIYTHETKMLFIEFQVKGQVHWTSKQQYDFQALQHYPFYLESPYHTHELNHGSKMFSIEFLVKRSKVKLTGHQSSNMVFI